MRERCGFAAPAGFPSLAPAGCCRRSDGERSSRQPSPPAGSGGGDRRPGRSLSTRTFCRPWSIALGYRLGEPDAADVVQTTWLKLLEHLETIRDPDRVGAWLATDGAPRMPARPGPGRPRGAVRRHRAAGPRHERARVAAGEGPDLGTGQDPVALLQGGCRCAASACSASWRWWLCRTRRSPPPSTWPSGASARRGHGAWSDFG